jgi:hypothetical protein
MPIDCLGANHKTGEATGKVLGNQMRNVKRRLRVLEQLPQYHPPPSQTKQIEDLVLRRLSDEDLALMTKMAGDLEAGVRRKISEREWTMLAAYSSLRETEAQRMGFESFAEAERAAGR